MTAGYAKKIEQISVRGLNGAGTIAFEGPVSHGSGKRYVGIELTPNTVLELAEALTCCPGAIDSPAHAVWHWENPGRSRPCPDHRGERKKPEDKKRKDALAIASTERGRTLYFIEQKLKQMEKTYASHDAGPGSTFARGLLQGVYDAIEAGEHTRP